MTRPEGHVRRTMAGDILEALRAGLARQAARAVAIERIGARDALARDIARDLQSGTLDLQVRTIARELEVPAGIVRDAVALAVARARVREEAARAAVEEGS